MKEQEVTIVKYWLNAEEILGARLCDSSGACLDCKLSVDQVTPSLGFLCIQHGFQVQVSDSLCNKLICCLPAGPLRDS